MSITKRFTFLIASLLLCGVAIAQSQQEIRDQFFGETDAVKKQADELNAKILAPAAYAEGLELYVSAGETLAKGKDLDRVREDLAEAKGFFARFGRSREIGERHVCERVDGARGSTNSGSREIRCKGLDSSRAIAACGRRDIGGWQFEEGRR